jgi:hypothetical protein
MPLLSTPYEIEPNIPFWRLANIYTKLLTERLNDVLSVQSVSQSVSQ